MVAICKDQPCSTSLLISLIMHYILKSKIWQFFLGIAFHSMQSASAHIHLASSHQHDGYSHSHSQVVHAHDVVSHHIDAFESNQNAHAIQTVELSPDWIVKYGKCLSDLESQAFLASSFPNLKLNINPQSLFDHVFIYYSSHFRSNVQARAPPILFYPLV